jgi:hypothetical protein
MTNNRGASQLAVRQHIGIRACKRIFSISAVSRRVMKVNWKLNKKMFVAESALREAEVAVRKKASRLQSFGSD